MIDISALAKNKFTQLLLQWNATSNDRQMPWKGEKDPYKIWLSEIILQQTRVEQGLSYFNKFVQHYPTIQQLANAKDEAVFKLWEGLGYYSRARNLLVTARHISTSFNNIFPNEYDSILALKGVGPYTAAAIASFAYNQPHAVVDGNVYRVLARVFNIDIATDSTEGKKFFAALAQDVIDTKRAGLYNQSIMDFGATVCKPAPLCSICPLQSICEAYKKGTVNTLPVKLKRLVQKNRWFYYFIFLVDDHILVHERTAKDIWQNLYEFYLFEAEKGIDWNETLIKEWLEHQLGIKNANVSGVSAPQIQKLTHQTIQGRFITVKLKKVPVSLKNLKQVKAANITKLAFPAFINKYLNGVDFTLI